MTTSDAALSGFVRSFSISRDKGTESIITHTKVHVRSACINFWLFHFIFFCFVGAGNESNKDDNQDVPSWARRVRSSVVERRGVGDVNPDALVLSHPSLPIALKTLLWSEKTSLMSSAMSPISTPVSVSLCVRCYAYIVPSDLLLLFCRTSITKMCISMGSQSEIREKKLRV